MLKFTLIFLGLCFVVGFALLVRGWLAASANRQEEVTPTPNADIYGDLRMQALSGSRSSFGLGPTAPDAPAWGVLMETGFPDGTATLVSMSDGSASLYFSGGGGVIGGIGHENVRRVAIAFVRLAGQRQSNMTATTMFPLPQSGRTVFYVLTDSGVFTVEADENDLGEQRHSLSSLFYAGHDVITQLRLVSDMK
jgi:hypothetical protein